MLQRISIVSPVNDQIYAAMAFDNKTSPLSSLQREATGWIVPAGPADFDELSGQSRDTTA